MPEYQASKNKYHNHIFTGDLIYGSINAMWGPNNASPYDAFSTTTKGSAINCGYGEGTMSAWNMKFSKTPTGSISYNGIANQASKPPTIAFMWILRFV